MGPWVQGAAQRQQLREDEAGAFGGQTSGGRGRNRSPSLCACPSEKGGVKATWAVCTRRFWSHVSDHSQGKTGFGGDAYFICRLVIWETKPSARQAAVISEAKVSNEDSVDRIRNRDNQGGRDRNTSLSP